MIGNGHDSNSRGAPESQKLRKPKPEDFNAGNVQKAVLAESLQHPATVYPVAGSVVAVAWTVVIAASPISIGLAIGGAVVGASVFIYNYVVKGEERAKAHVTRLRELRRECEQQEVRDLSDDCLKAGFPEGAAAARDLTRAYRSLLDHIKDNLEAKQGLTFERFGILAEDTYRQGESVLQQALSIYKAIQSVDAPALEKDVVHCQSARKHMDDNSASAKALDQQIASQTRRIELCKQKQDKLVQLLAQANEIEAALQSTYLELADLGSQDPTALLGDDGGACIRLQSAVEAARRVEQRLRGEDAEEKAREDKYRNPTDSE